jgi:copper chaperone CopZ
MLKKTSGVEEAEVLFTSSKVKVTFNEEQIQSDQIKKRITNLGYDVLGEK